MLSIAEGEVFIMKSGTDDWVEAEVGATVETGDVIRADDSSCAEITFFDGSILELEAGTQVEVAELDFAVDTGSTTIMLKQEVGKTISRVMKLADPASRYEVETPAGVAVVRGTIMVINVGVKGITTIINELGVVWVIAEGVEVELPEGEQCLVIPGRPPRIVQRDGGGGGGGGASEPKPGIAMSKLAEPARAHVGEAVIYTYTVTNTGNTPLSGVVVGDDKAGDASYHGGDSNGDSRLDVGEEWTYRAGYVVGSGDVSPLVNTAAVSGTDALDQTVIAWASASVEILRPGIAMSKVGEPIQVSEGDTVTYTYTVTNTGDTPLSGVSVSDDRAGEASYQSGDSNGDGRLDVGEEWTYRAGYVVGSGDVSPLVNTAAAFGTDKSSYTVTAGASAEVYVLRDYVLISVEIDEEMAASIFIWDDTEDQWAEDKDTLEPVDGTYHTTPQSIAVAAGHYYTVWIEKEGYAFQVTSYPEGWSTTPQGDKVEGFVAGTNVEIDFSVVE